MLPHEAPARARELLADPRDPAQVASPAQLLAALRGLQAHAEGQAGRIRALEYQLEQDQALSTLHADTRRTLTAQRDQLQRTLGQVQAMHSARELGLCEICPQMWPCDTALTVMGVGGHP